MYKVLGESTYENVATFEVPSLNNATSGHLYLLGCEESQIESICVMLFCASPVAYQIPPDVSFQVIT
jgi:hypothetical protein